MKKSAYVRFSITMFLLFSMLSPTALMAADGDKGSDKQGKKHFKAGMKAEDTEMWDKAAEEFALAIVEDPKNPEYRLHYQRSLFNASQMYMKRGRALAEEKDYAGAYLAFRKAYAYDPTNELAQSETMRMLRLQKALTGDDADTVTSTDGTDLKLVRTGYGRQPSPQDTVVPQKLEKLRDLPFPSGVNLQFIIKQLAQELDLNVLFDSESFRDANRKVNIELKNVTAAKALDYIFLQEGLFFQKVGPRTIMIGIQNRRQFFQQLVLRTFYLSNADPTEVAKTVQAAIPAQPGRTPTIPLVDKSTNSITVRDTTENIRIIGSLIDSLDKDRAEVVMDVQIYEVNKTDLLQLGNQIGTSSSLANLGGTTGGTFGNNEYGVLQSASTVAGTAARIVAQPFGIGLSIPAINLIALQNKQNTKLIASTQIHAFNNEDSQARIGQRVPVRSAQLLGFGNSTGTGTGTGGTNNGFNNAASVYNYEQTGLTLKFKPIVFPNQDVQVAMEIESKDVVAGTTTDGNPTFTERTIKGTARVQNNKTLLLASVAQNNQSNGRTGLPLLGLIPIIGRLFTAPTKNNSQVDIVIAVTPRVIRAPAILPEDLIERPTGSLATPTSGSLEAMIVEEERDEQLAAARRIPNVAKVQLPDQAEEVPAYVKTASMQDGGAKVSTDATAENQLAATDETESAPVIQVSNVLAANLKPIDSGVKTLQIIPTSDTSGNKLTMQQTTLKVTEETPIFNAPSADLKFVSDLREMKAGEKTVIAVMLRSATAFRSATLGLAFDAKKMAVRGVSYGDVFGADMAQTGAKPFLNENGKMYITLASPKDTAQNSSGMLAYIEVEALADGKQEISFVKDILNVLTADGKNFVVKY